MVLGDMINGVLLARAEMWLLRLLRCASDGLEFPELEASYLLLRTENPMLTTVETVFKIVFIMRG